MGAADGRARNEGIEDQAVSLSQKVFDFEKKKKEARKQGSDKTRFHFY